LVTALTILAVFAVAYVIQLIGQRRGPRGPNAVALPGSSDIAPPPMPVAAAAVAQERESSFLGAADVVMFSGFVGAADRMLVFDDALVFARLKTGVVRSTFGEQRAKLEALARGGELGTWAAKASLPDAAAIRTADVSEAVLTRSFVGAAYGYRKLWIKPTTADGWVAWTVKKKWRQQVVDLLEVALGDRFQVRSKR
jgi:hypothetical protein